jgi:hypothetical protein
MTSKRAKRRARGRRIEARPPYSSTALCMAAKAAAILGHTIKALGMRIGQTAMLRMCETRQKRIDIH